MILRLFIKEKHIEIDLEYIKCTNIIDDIEHICKETRCTFNKESGCIDARTKVNLYKFLYIISGWYDCIIEQWGIEYVYFYYLFYSSDYRWTMSVELSIVLYIIASYGILLFIDDKLKGQSMNLSKEDCIEVCTIRELFKRDCTNCVYYNEKICNKLKAEYEAARPSELECYYDNEKRKRIRRKNNGY